jgi:signal transduction histidine kinase
VAIQTLSDMLLFDKIQSQMITLERSRVDLAELIREVNRIAGISAQTKNVSVDLKHDLTETEMCQLICSGDKFKLKQVINNFLSNAVKFSPQNSQIIVWLKVLPAFSYKAGASSAGAARSIHDHKASVSSAGYEVVRVEVTDSGAGISKENLRQLFGQYVQFNANTLQGGKGSGLGLWLSKAIIELHDGIIGAESVGEGSGSTFFFELPLLPASLRTPRNIKRESSFHNIQR